MCYNLLGEFMKRYFCIILCVISTIYSIFYASFGGFLGNESALSKIGLDHPVLFAIWGLITLFTLCVNIVIAFMETKYKFYIILLVIAAVGMILTISFDFDYDKKPDYYIHCIGSLAFSAIMGITVFLLFLLKKSYVLASVTAVILFADLMLLIIYKETAFIELAPIFAGYIMLSIHNTVKRRIPVNVKWQT